MSSAGVISTQLQRVMYAGILLVICVAISSCVSSSLPVTGAVNNPVSPETGPIIVKITNPGVQTAIAHVVETNETDSLDQNILALTACSQGQRISVWAPGYYVKSFLCSGSAPTEYPVQLDAINSIDNPNYTWIDADLRTDATRNCAGCHSGTQGLTEYLEWNKDGHSRAFADPFFWTMYMGMDINRNSSQQTQWGISGNGQKIRFVPDPVKTDYGPGYHLDYPNENGNCIYCHVPTGVSNTQQEMNLYSLINNTFGNRVNVMTEGVTCDVCHKVTDVFLGDDQLPYADRPGVLSMSFVRPNSMDPFFVGPKPFELVPESGAKKTCSPVFSESKFCSVCHYGKFSDTEIYGSYKEWLDSPYNQEYIRSDDGQIIGENENYRSCQDCHMLSPEQIVGTFPSQRDACSETNLNFRDFNHNMMSYGPDPANPSREIPLLVQRAAKISIDEPKIEDGLIKFKVTVLNTGAGHKFPTDSPLRHLILVVQVTAQSTSLPQISGPTIPEWAAQDYAGYPGEIYANILKDRDTNATPTFAYWNHTEPAWPGSDTRLLPGQAVQKEYWFTAPSNGSAVITAKLIYRKAFIKIARQKGWPLIDLDIEAANAPPVVLP